MDGRLNDKISHTFRLSREDLEWLARNERPASQQLRDDLRMLRSILRAKPELQIGDVLSLFGE